jgi:hypothetical protein
MTSLQDALTGLRAELAGSQANLNEALLRIATFGISGAVPADPAQLTIQAQSVEREASGRLTRAQAASAPADTLREVFGSLFVIAPVFRPANAEDLAKTWTNSTQLQGGTPTAALNWFSRICRVREGMSRLEDAFRYAEAVASGAELNLRVGQLPLRENDRWVALPLADGKPLPPGTLSLVTHVNDTFDAAGPLAGLLIDEWIETVPNATETTGVAFQYNQPDATPPQSVLIAVPPRVDQPWTVDTLQNVLAETMDLARMRVVDPSLLGEIQHFLPALYFASNAQDDTVSTDWAPMVR